MQKKRRGLVYLSGNLTVKNLVPLLGVIADHATLDYVTDGYLPQVLEEVGVDAKLISIDSDLSKYVANYDFVISGICSPGRNERQLLRICRDAKVKTHVILADIASSVRKFEDLDGRILPNVLYVSDRLSYQNLLESGISPEILVPLGSPYFDKIASVKGSSGSGIGLASVPNLLDFSMWGSEALYDEFAVALDVQKVANELGLDVTIRLHPKEDNTEEYRNKGVHAIIESSQKNDIVDFISSHLVIVSTYSTTLLVAAALGKPAISYQPCREGIRTNLYRLLGIPVARNMSELIRNIRDQTTGFKPHLLIYNERNAVQKFREHWRNQESVKL